MFKHINHRKLKAFLDLISWAEGTDHADPYKVLVTSRLDSPILFDSFSTHPERLIHVRPGLLSSAAGRYQIIQNTYSYLCRRYNFKDFSPETQDRMAYVLINENGAIEDIIKKCIDEAIQKLGGVWASFPNNNYNQPQRKTELMLKKYEQFLSKY